jgi:D-alanyl-D-alanine dipeptidase
VKAHFENFPPELRATMIGSNRTYVSLPSKDVLCPSPHSTGCSVDVWLFKDGKAENLGVPFDWMEKNAGAFYHLKIRRNRFPGNDRLICQNRKLLLLAMIKASLTCYGPEIWHLNYGNQMDALVKGDHAIYSYIEP